MSPGHTEVLNLLFREGLGLLNLGVGGEGGSGDFGHEGSVESEAGQPTCTPHRAPIHLFPVHPCA
jgi:hypothetical protein